MTPQNLPDSQPHVTTTQDNPILKAALWMLANGLSVIPIRFKGKAASNDWKQFQTRLATKAEVKSWFAAGLSNYGIVTGKISGIAVIDCDSPEDAEYVARTYPTPWVVKTAKGWHFYYKYPGSHVSGAVRVDGKKIDIRGDGNQCVGPRSVHETGIEYSVEKPWEFGAKESLPIFPLEILRGPSEKSSSASDIPKGGRARLIERARRYLANTPLPVEGNGSDSQVYSVLCRLTGYGKDDIGLSRDEVLPLLEEWQPAFDREWWKEKIENAGQYAQNKVGSREHEVDAKFVSMADIEPKPTKWLWKPRIPIGNITILEGDPGIGKSFITVRLAADVSQGRNCFPKGRVLWMSAEDDAADTIKPRLMAADADYSQIFVANSAFTLDTRGVENLRNQIEEKRPLLVIVDPLAAFVGGKTNVNADNEIREILSPLKDAAAKYETAMLLVRHLNKTGKEKAIYRGSGSMGITGAARSVLLAGYDINNKSESALVHIKCNVAEKAPSLGYEIESTTVDGIETARLEWTGESEISAENILGSEFNTKPDKPTAIDAATDFLRTMLASGPMAAKALEDEARRQDIAGRTLKRAKSTLGVESFKNGGGWSWRLPDGVEGRIETISAGEGCHAF